MNDIKKFDKAYFDEDCLVLEKSTGEASGFFVRVLSDSMELYSIPQYGGRERFEQAWEYSNPIEAYDLAMTWS